MTARRHEVTEKLNDSNMVSNVDAKVPTVHERAVS